MFAILCLARYRMVRTVLHLQNLLEQENDLLINCIKIENNSPEKNVQCIVINM